MYYVYELQYPDGTPFYVGKGKEKRHLNHFNNEDTNNKFKCKVIGKIRRNGGEPKSIIVEDNLTEDKAFELECSLIAHYGRRDNNTGILTNLTNGGEGASGYVFTEEDKLKVRIGLKNSNRTLSENGRLSLIAARSKSVLQYDVGGFFIKEYNSMKLAGELLGISSANISKCVVGTNPTAGGYQWKIKRPYIEEKIEPYINKNLSKIIYQYDKEYNIIASFESSRKASLSTGVNRANIISCCKGRVKTAGGFVWSNNKKEE